MRWQLPDWCTGSCIGRTPLAGALTAILIAAVTVTTALPDILTCYFGVRSVHARVVRRLHHCALGVAHALEVLCRPAAAGITAAIRLHGRFAHVSSHGVHARTDMCMQADMHTYELTNVWRCTAPHRIVRHGMARPMAHARARTEPAGAKR